MDQLLSEILLYKSSPNSAWLEIVVLQGDEKTSFTMNGQIFRLQQEKMCMKVLHPDYILLMASSYFYKG
jgi:hypothetical protein